VWAVERLYWAGAVSLAPWIVYLFGSQTPRAEAHQVHALVVGLIAMMSLAMLATSLLSRRGSPYSVMSAAYAATVTFISAWFRVLTRTGGARWEGSTPVFLALVVTVVALCVVVIRREMAARPGRPSTVRWIPIALAIAAVAVLPALVIALVVVPELEVAHRLRLAWTGLDVFELVALAWTGTALHRHAAVAIVPATITGALLVCDAWINVVPSTAAQQAEGITLAFVELPLAALSFWVAARTTRSAFVRGPRHLGALGDRDAAGIQ
jgi:hypothetical protein